MKKGLAVLFAAAALVGCSPQKEGARSETGGETNMQQGAVAPTNEAAGADMTNAPSAPSTNAPGGASTNQSQ